MSSESKSIDAENVTEAADSLQQGGLEVSQDHETSRTDRSVDDISSCSSENILILDSSSLQTCQTSTDSIRGSVVIDTKLSASPSGIIPHGMDPSVFAGLPSEMQQELLAEWKQGSYEITSVDLRRTGKQSHLQAKRKGRGKSISDYFKK